MDGWYIIAVIMDFGIQNADLDTKRGVDGVLFFFFADGLRWMDYDGWIDTQGYFWLRTLWDVE